MDRAHDYVIVWNMINNLYNVTKYVNDKMVVIKLMLNNNHKY